MSTAVESLRASLADWSLVDACWLEPGTLLQSTAHRYGYLLVSPVFALQTQHSYTFCLRLEFLQPGGVTFGLQDHAGQQWLHVNNYTGAGSCTCRLQFRPKQTDRFRLVLANCFPDTPAVNRLRLLSLETTSDVARGPISQIYSESASSLRVHVLEPPHLWQGPLLCVTHSQRPVELEQCSRETLARRYGNPDRLRTLVPFDRLTPAAAHTAWKGQLTIWRFEQGNWQRPRLLAQLEPYHYKPQHALWHGGRLWLLGSEVLEVYDATLRRLAVLQDPWLAGGHTIARDGKGQLLLSCSASDAVLVVDEDTLQVTDALRVPEAIYGRNYALTRADSVVEHFVINDYQLTHLNSAWPYRDGWLISAFIQGAIGWFDANGSYRELLRGFLGCHSVRTSRAGTVYFSDSARGTIVFLDQRFRIVRRLDLRSHWLHDALELDESTWAAALADRNEVLLFDPSTGQLRHRLDGSPFGASTQFLAFGQ